MKNFLLSTLVLLASSAIAHADSITFTLNQNGCSSSCGTAPYGTVVLTQTSATTVTVTETLTSGEHFAGTGAGDSLAFNITGDPSITIANLTSGFEVGPTDVHASTFGYFDYSVTCDYTGGACHGGNSTNSVGPLSFTVTDASGLSVYNFIENGTGFSFASDIVGTNGNTGNVAAIAGVATTTPTPVASTPEPSSLLLLGTGAAGFAGMLRRRSALNLS